MKNKRQLKNFIKSTLKEAGFYDYRGINPNQQNDLRALEASVTDPRLRATIANMMKGGMDLDTAVSSVVQRMQQTGIQVDPGLQSLMNRNTTVTPPPAQFMQKYGNTGRVTPKKPNVPVPPQFLAPEQRPLKGKQSTDQGINSAKQKATKQTLDHNNREKDKSWWRKERNKPQQPQQQSQVRQPQQRKSYDQAAFEKTLHRQAITPPAPQQKSNLSPFQNLVDPRRKQVQERKVKNKIESIVIQEAKKKIARKILQEQIDLQVETRRHAVKLLVEMPDVWSKIKAAGSAAAALPGKARGWLKGADVTGQDAMAQRREQMVQKVGQMIEKRLRQAEQERRKFNSNILKTTQIMNAYHNSVMQAFAAYKQYEDTLGPQGMEFNRQINKALEDLEQDLMAEISHISKMLQNVGAKDDSLDARLQQYDERSAEMREKEASLNAPGPSSFRKDMGYGDKAKADRQSVHQDFAKDVRANRLRDQARADAAKKQPKVTISSSGKGPKEEDETDKSLTRIKLNDKATYKKIKAQLDDIEEAYQDLSKDLTKRTLGKNVSPEERKNILNQMMNLIKSRKEKEKELMRTMKGLGIRSKAGMTALGNA